MKKLQAPALPVKVIGASAVHGAEQVDPFVQRWLDMQRVHLERHLSRCKTAQERMLVLALLSCEDTRGPILQVSLKATGSSTNEHLVPLATGDDDMRLIVRRDLPITGRPRLTVPITITTNYMRVAVQIDDIERARSEREMSARYARDIGISANGWTPVWFMGDHVAADPDAVAEKIFGLLGISVHRSAPLQPSAIHKATEDPALEQCKEGASTVLAALAEMPEGPISRSSMGKR